MKKFFDKLTKINYRAEGSFTVEAAFIVIIIIFSVTLLIKMMFFLYNGVVAESDADCMVFEKEDSIRAKKREKDSTDTIHRSGRGYLYVENLENVLDVNDTVITADINADIGMNIPIPYFDSLFGNINLVRKYEVRDFSRTGRIIAAVFDTVDMVKKIFKRNGD